LIELRKTGITFYLKKGRIHVDVRKDLEYTHFHNKEGINVC
jgi:hypothetical protein